MSSFTCNGCEVQFPTSDDQRQHMKSEWHRYNLKRRVAQLAPIPEGVFNSKVQAISAESNKDDGKKKQLTKKEIRRREKEALLEKKRELLKVAHENAAKNIQKEEQKSASEQPKPESKPESKPEPKPEPIPEEKPKHEEPELTEDQLAEKLMGEKISNRVDIPPEECLFCSKKHSDLDSNVDHMLKSHGFFIPEQKYLVDKAGLVKYLSEKIGLGNICIVCNYQGRSLEAVRQHMLAKRHCRIPYEEEDERLEISDFYDFTSSYGEPAAVEATGDANEEDWEDVDEEGDEESDEEVFDDAVYHDGVELHLPTGVKVGHRSMMKYYRQNLRPESEVTEGQGTVMAAETRKMLRPYDRQGAQTQMRSWKQESRNKKQQDKKSAKHLNFQPHYRDQLLQ